MRTDIPHRWNQESAGAATRGQTGFKSKAEQERATGQRAKSKAPSVVFILRGRQEQTAHPREATGDKSKSLGLQAWEKSYLLEMADPKQLPHYTPPFWMMTCGSRIPESPLRVLSAVIAPLPV